MSLSDDEKSDEMGRKNMYFSQDNIDKWEKFCKDNFKTKRVLSKVMTEAMDQYIVNFKN